MVILVSNLETIIIKIEMNRPWRLESRVNDKTTPTPPQPNRNYLSNPFL